MYSLRLFYPSIHPSIQSFIRDDGWAIDHLPVRSSHSIPSKDRSTSEEKKKIEEKLQLQLQL